MKKFFVTIFAILYLAVSCGATVNMHYCMNRLMSWDLSPTSKSKCGSCGMEKAGHKGCCHDEHKQIKIEKDQKASESSFQKNITSTDAALTSLFSLAVVYPNSTVLDNPSTHAPPLSGAVPIFVLNCNFRI